jgi:myo-inositol-1(or 4)-monophosphatase
MKVRDVRRNGSAALDLCFVACGRHDFYFEQYLKAWDVSAAHLMVEEAGGKFSDFHGKPISYAEAKSENDKYAVFGSNGHVHAAVLESFDAARRAHATK